MSESRRQVSFLRGGREKVGEEKEREREKREKGQRGKGGAATWARGRQRQKGNGGRLSGGLRGSGDDGFVVRQRGVEAKGEGEPRALSLSLSLFGGKGNKTRGSKNASTD